MAEESRFTGYPAGGRATAVPNIFFASLLPKMDDPAEILVTFYFFYIWQQQRRYPRYITYNDLASDLPLRQALSHLPGATDAALRQGLSLALQRGTILRAPVEGEGEQTECYFLNVPAARRTLERLPKAVAGSKQTTIADSWDPPPNIFRLYEENIGAISPLIVHDLIECEARYPSAWLEAAVKEAVRHNKRNWRYVQRILERWAVEGPDYEETGRDTEREHSQQRLSGRYGRLVDR